KYGFHLIDAGRVIQNMQVTAWNYGVGSGIFTGIKEEIFRRDFGIPKELNVAAVIGFGYPLKKLTGKRKDRLPLTVLVHKEKYSNTNQR
ncbi:MAG: nitroreductase family protein, partial [Nitrososphaeraceae archaeon]|nr:nitroreductase family protein [Nitrososphaeraceae archaeon]